MTPALRAALAPGALRNRWLSAAAVALYGAGALALVPDPDRRATLHSAAIVTLGYGHLLGALLAPLARRGRAAVSRPTSQAQHPARAVLAAAALALAFAAFTGALARELAVVLALLAVSTWHTAENDLALESAYKGGGRPGPPARDLDEQLAALGVAGAVLALGAAALAADASGELLRAQGADARPLAWWLRGGVLLIGGVLLHRERSPRCESLGLSLVGAAVLLDEAVLGWLGATFADVFAWATGYHLASWIVLTLDGTRRSGRATARLLAASHAVPLGFATACFADDGGAAAALRTAFFAPAPYLFWSVAHVGHTLWLRSRRGPD